MKKKSSQQRARDANLSAYWVAVDVGPWVEMQRQSP